MELGGGFLMSVGLDGRVFVDSFCFIYSTSQKFGHTYSFHGFSLFLQFSTLQNNSEVIQTMK